MGKRRAGRPGGVPCARRRPPLSISLRPRSKADILNHWTGGTMLRIVLLAGALLVLPSTVADTTFWTPGVSGSAHAVHGDCPCKRQCTGRNRPISECHRGCEQRYPTCRKGVPHGPGKKKS